METVSVSLFVAKETYEAAKAAGAIVSKTIEVSKDGFQPGQDLPAILTTAVTEGLVGLQGADKIDNEARENPVAFASALMVGLIPVVGAFLKKNDEGGDPGVPDGTPNTTDPAAPPA